METFQIVVGIWSCGMAMVLGRYEESDVVVNPVRNNTVNERNISWHIGRYIHDTNVDILDGLMGRMAGPAARLMHCCTRGSSWYKAATPSP